LRPLFNQAQCTGFPPPPDCPADGEKKDRWQAENHKENQRETNKN
jgi:hypothetical protein